MATEYEVHIFSLALQNWEWAWATTSHILHPNWKFTMVSRLYNEGIMLVHEHRFKAWEKEYRVENSHKQSENSSKSSAFKLVDAITTDHRDLHSA